MPSDIRVEVAKIALGKFAGTYTSQSPFVDTKTGADKKKSHYRTEWVSPHDEKVLHKIRKRAWRLDMCLMHCCGIQFGWAAVLGLLPVVGDLLGFYLAHRLICKAEDIEGGLPSTLRAKMYLFAIIDVVGGFVPFFGDIFDAFYKANTRNAWLLEDYLSTKGEAKAKGMQSVLPEGHDVDMEMLGEGEQPHPPQQAHKYGRR